MTQLNPAWAEALCRGLEPLGYFKQQSMEFKEVAVGRAQVEIPVGPGHMQPFGVVHGGVIAGLMDAAGFWSIFPSLAEGVAATTVELKVNYLAPCMGGRLVGKGQAIKIGQTLSLAEGRIFDNRGRLLAHGTTTVMTLPEVTLALGDLPPKFLE